MRILSCVFIFLFLGINCVLAQVAVLYRDDVPFYKKIVEEFKNIGVQVCPINKIDKCFDDNIKMVITLGDSAFKSVLPYKNKYKIYAFFVTKCRTDLSVCCFYLFPTPSEILAQINVLFPGKKVVYLYTEKTKWWINDFRKAPKYLLELHDVKENLRKIFLKDFDLAVLAPDLLFMHPAFLKELVILSLSTSKILVGLSPMMLDYGIDVIIYYDYNGIINQLVSGNIESLKKIRIPIKVKRYGFRGS